MNESFSLAGETALITGGGWYEFDAYGYIYGEWDTPPE